MTTFRCIDFESTGLPTPDEPHAIVEIGTCDVTWDNAPAKIGEPNAALCDPGRPIPFEAMAVHHITNDMVKGAQGSTEYLGAPDYFVAHAADFERAFFRTEIPFLCTYKVALRIWPDAPSHSLQFLRYYLGLEVDAAKAMPPHRAGPDAYVCAALLAAILVASEHSIEDMVRWSNGPALLPRLPLGKHKGQKWEDVPTHYLDWIVNKSGLDRDMKANARHHLKTRASQSGGE